MASGYLPKQLEHEEDIFLDVSDTYSLCASLEVPRYVSYLGLQPQFAAYTQPRWTWQQTSATDTVFGQVWSLHPC